MSQSPDYDALCACGCRYSEHTVQRGQCARHGCDAPRSATEIARCPRCGVLDPRRDPLYRPAAPQSSPGGPGSVPRGDESADDTRSAAFSAVGLPSPGEPVYRPDDMTVAEERAAGCDCGSIDGGHPGDCAMFKPLSRPGTPGGESDG